MGRGRAKAKQTRVARELKYSSPNTDLSALQKELTGAAIVVHRTLPGRRTTTTMRTTSTPTAGRTATRMTIGPPALVDRPSSPLIRPTPLPPRGAAVSSCAPAGRTSAPKAGLSGRCRPGARRERRPDGAGCCPPPRTGRRRPTAGRPPGRPPRRRRRRPCPTPQLNARSDSARGTPCSSSSRTTGGSAQVPRSSTAARPSGTTRAALPASPPPVMCAKACTLSTPSSRTSARQSRA